MKFQNNYYIEQVVKVQADAETFYIMYEVKSDAFEGFRYEIYEDDGNGNGTIVCDGTDMLRMRSMVLRLGDFIQWGIK